MLALYMVLAMMLSRIPDIVEFAVVPLLRHADTYVTMTCLIFSIIYVNKTISKNSIRGLDIKLFCRTNGLSSDNKKPPPPQQQQ